MNNLKIYYLFFFYTILLYACASKVQVYEVTQIIDGNTVQLSNGQSFKLIGIKGTSESQNYLQNNLLNQRITLNFDSGKYPVYNETSYVYINKIDGNVAINSSLLKQGIASFDNQYIKDSLKIFKGYSSSNITASSSRSKPKAFKKSKPNKRRTQKSTREIVQEVESGVFTIITLDRKGNELGSGTGFFIDSSGRALSNFHVFEGGETWLVKILGSNTVYDVSSIIHSDKERDFILFKVDIPNSKINELVLSDKGVEKGEEILALGNPKGLESTLTKGIVSSKRYYDELNLDYIQIDAAVSSGNSGGPVLDMYGEVVGITTFKLLGCDDCNFAIDIFSLKSNLASYNIFL